ncbi:NAD(P)H-dependent oxidoreductase [Pontivivens ytuae]|uniref:NAD(P)H-dependent oxidoreductase n=1 Tax=Pontivivens ytuae TaxID=2789856 RepID=A0A7S9LV54_9RHOB|nr:NAD(P)H-dependent oxidoreductase [Pontivivens ytuae]QPH55906.1 NAD(P)H-dependent oxidoreductase [Pontivivens ytuae]
MRALVLYAHPVPDSFGSVLHARTVRTLRDRGWDVDDCDLNAEGFSPVLTEAERRGYHTEPANIEPVREYVERLRAAQALVLCFPVWNFGYPAILKGFFDRVFLPGVSFKLVNGKVRPNLTHIEKLAAVTTYGGNRTRAFLAGDPPRRIVTRSLRYVCHPRVKTKYLALYDMNRATDERRRGFHKRVMEEMREF